jgi:hypothetical protein
VDTQKGGERMNMREYFDDMEYVLWHYSNEKLIDIKKMLDMGEWPKGLPGKPDRWENKSAEAKNCYSIPIGLMIEKLVGTKAVDRSEKDEDVSDQEFDDEWDSLLMEKVNNLNDKISEQRKMILEISEQITHGSRSLCVVLALIAIVCSFITLILES